MGWRLLMNEHVVLEKGDEKIALLGIENWGAKARFPKYGKMMIFVMSSTMNCTISAMV
jgi:hypothetical protein